MLEDVGVEAFAIGQPLDGQVQRRQMASVVQAGRRTDVEHHRRLRIPQLIVCTSTTVYGVTEFSYCFLFLLGRRPKPDSNGSPNALYRVLPSFIELDDDVFVHSNDLLLELSSLTLY